MYIQLFYSSDLLVSEYLWTADLECRQKINKIDHNKLNISFRLNCFTLFMQHGFVSLHIDISLSLTAGISLAGHRYLWHS